MNKKELKYVQKEFTKGSAAVIKYRRALKSVCEHLEYLVLAEHDRVLGDDEKLAMWNSGNTVNVLREAKDLLG